MALSGTSSNHYPLKVRSGAFTDHFSRTASKFDIDDIGLVADDFHQCSMNQRLAPKVDSGWALTP
jgi:hypothetical protein